MYRSVKGSTVGKWILVLFLTQRDVALSAFVMFRITVGHMTISFVMSVCPSVHMEQLGFHWTYFDEA
jgi:hypothetical protein